MVSKLPAIIVFLFIASFSLAQKATVIKITKEELKKAYRINDLIKVIPNDCKVNSYVYSIVVMGSEKTQEISGDLLENWLKSNHAILNGVFFIEKINSECRNKHKQKYKIVVN
jgi:hypothetical protein